MAMIFCGKACLSQDVFQEKFSWNLTSATWTNRFVQAGQRDEYDQRRRRVDDIFGYITRPTLDKEVREFGEEIKDCIFTWAIFIQSYHGADFGSGINLGFVGELRDKRVLVSTIRGNEEFSANVWQFEHWQKAPPLRRLSKIVQGLLTNEAHYTEAPIGSPHCWGIYALHLFYKGKAGEKFISYGSEVGEGPKRSDQPSHELGELLQGALFCANPKPKLWIDLGTGWRLPDK